MDLAELIAQIRWRPQIGDPSVMGWATVIAYGVAAVLCLVAVFRNRTTVDVPSARLRHSVWLGVALLMAFLCLNKQLDLQSLLTDVGRVLAKQEGWYGQRRAVQRWFVVSVAAAGATTLAFLVWRARTIFRERIVLAAGLALLLTFVIIRAASFHHVDVLIQSRIIGLRINWILELGGIALVAWGAIQSCFSRTKTARKSGKNPRPAGRSGRSGS